MSKNKSLKASERDSLDEILDKNEFMVDKLRILEKEIRRLKIENKSIRSELNKAESYLFSVTENDSIEKIEMEDFKRNTKRCPSCSSIGIEDIKLGKFNIAVCKTCGYRKRFDEGKITKNKKN